MNGIQITRLSLPEVLLITPQIHSDSRGLFLESYHREKYAELGISCDFVQDNHSTSRMGTIRGLHYQLPKPQAKLCRVVQGRVLDVAVDVRVGSPTFGKFTSVILTAESHQQLFIPAGFAHGFAVLSPSADFLYKCSEYFDSKGDKGVLWNDPALGIQWPKGEAIISPKDSAYSRLADIAVTDLPTYP